MKRILLIAGLIICLLIAGCTVPQKGCLLIEPKSMNLLTAGNWVILPITITYYADYSDEGEDVTLSCDYNCIQIYTNSPLQDGDPSIWINEFDCVCLQIPDLRNAGEIVRVKTFVTYEETTGIFTTLVFRI